MKPLIHVEITINHHVHVAHLFQKNKSSNLFLVIHITNNRDCKRLPNRKHYAYMYALQLYLVTVWFRMVNVKRIKCWIPVIKLCAYFDIPIAATCISANTEPSFPTEQFPKLPNMCVPNLGRKYWGKTQTGFASPQPRTDQSHCGKLRPSMVHPSGVERTFAQTCWLACKNMCVCAVLGSKFAPLPVLEEVFLSNRHKQASQWEHGFDRVWKYIKHATLQQRSH